MSRKHCKHTKSVINAQRYHDGVCIDTSAGIYLVADTLKGNNNPAHVQKSLLVRPTRVLHCESQWCVNTVAGISNKTNYECSHLQTIQYITTTANNVQLQEGTLDKLIASKRLKPESKPLLLHHKYMAETSGNVLVSAWMTSNYQTRWCIYLSVWIGVIHYYSKMGRVLLAFDQLLHNICCYCTHSTKKGCIHKSVAKWYLNEVVQRIFDKSSLCIVIENTLEKCDNNYLCRLTDYLMESAKLPFEIPDDCLKETFSTFQLHVIK